MACDLVGVIRSFFLFTRKGFGDMNLAWIILALLLGVIVVAAGAVALKRWLDRRTSLVQKNRDQAARLLFQQRREWLEADFLKQSSQSGMPRGLNWVDCDFSNPIVFARDRQSGELRAFVGVTISFEAIAGGPMEDVEAVGNLREATAVFLFRQGRWITDGRAVFNLDPDETIRRFAHELETVD